ncbi:MAG: hypothetical protein DRJ52_07490, partial [Thermoprotei archaeon]
MVVVVLYICFNPTLALDGFEYLRRLKPIEKVYILYDMKKDRYGAVSKRNAKKVYRKLSFFRPQPVKVNPVSFENVFFKLYPLVYAESLEGREIYIDVTSMPPEMVSCVTTIALMVPRVYLYVVPAIQRGDFIPNPGTPRFEEWLEEKDNKRGLEPVKLMLPEERLEILDDSEKPLAERILITLYEKGGKANAIKDLIEWCGENPRDNVVKNRYSRMIDDLVRKGLVYK